MTKMNDFLHQKYELGYSINKTEFDPPLICEPTPRMCAGYYQYVFHRFPIVGGISTLEGMLGNIKLTIEKLSRDTLMGKTK